MPNEEIEETIFARGHENVQATHATTFEITKEPRMSKKGDCIIAVLADKGIPDLSSEFKKTLRRNGAKLTITIETGDETETINALGDSELILNHPTDMVVRKSDYMCSRTLAIRADKAACDFSRRLVEKLKNPHQKVKISLTATV